MNSLLILSHAAANSHLHASQIVTLALVSVLVVTAIVLFGHRSIIRK